MEKISSLSIESDPRGLIPAGISDRPTSAEYFVVASYRVIEPVSCAGRAVGHTCVPASWSAHDSARSDIR